MFELCDEETGEYAHEDEPDHALDDDCDDRDVAAEDAGVDVSGAVAHRGHRLDAELERGGEVVDPAHTAVLSETLLADVEAAALEHSDVAHVAGDELHHPVNQGEDEPTGEEANDKEPDDRQPVEVHSVVRLQRVAVG